MLMYLNKSELIIFFFHFAGVRGHYGKACERLRSEHLRATGGGDQGLPSPSEGETEQIRQNTL